MRIILIGSKDCDSWMRHNLTNQQGNPLNQWKYTGAVSLSLSKENHDVNTQTRGGCFIWQSKQKSKDDQNINTEGKDSNLSYLYLLFQSEIRTTYSNMEKKTKTKKKTVAVFIALAKLWTSSNQLWTAAAYYACIHFDNIQQKKTKMAEVNCKNLSWMISFHKQLTSICMITIF